MAEVNSWLKIVTWFESDLSFVMVCFDEIEAFVAKHDALVAIILGKTDENQRKCSEKWHFRIAENIAL